MRRSILLGLLLCLACPACRSKADATDEKTLYVSILPLRSVVQKIVGDDFRVEVLVPPGASPETFELSPKQLAGLNKAQLIFTVGLLDYERNLIAGMKQSERIVDLSRGIERLSGSCAHAHGGHAHAEDDCTVGVDPHIWTSPRQLEKMAENAYLAIERLYPDSARYERNWLKLSHTLNKLDSVVGCVLKESRLPYFVVYHPALSYYARDYGMRQVSVEEDGKEPSARSLARLIAQAKADSVRKIFYQKQFPVSVVEVIASDMNAEPIEFDPLAEDILAQIAFVTNQIATQ